MTAEPPPPPKSRKPGIMLRTALFAWLVSVVTLLLFVVALLPQEKETFLENLRSKAYGVTVSLRDVAAGAVVNEDYSSVVDHCTEMLKGDPAIDYIVITRNDGFSLVHDRNGWYSKQLDPRWRPAARVPSGGIETVPLFDRRVYAYAQPFNYSGIEWGWIHVGLSLTSYDRSLFALYRQTAILILLCAVVGFAAAMSFARRLVRPILTLQDTVRRIARGDLAARAQVARDDEIGELATSVNLMTEALLRRDRTLKEANETLEQRVRERTSQLETQITARAEAHRELAETQQRLIQLSREAGMAEVATGILHNVGNVLNSVNVSANLLRDQVAGNQRIALLQQTADLLRAQGGDVVRYLAEDPRGRLVLPLLCEIADELSRTQAFATREFQTLAQNIDHIKQIVSVQQNYAKAGGLIQTFDPAELFHDALNITKASATRHGVTITPDFAPTRQPLTTDRHLALQILVNLLKNSIQAVKPRPTGRRFVTLRLAQSASSTQFSVQDNGVGIAAEDRHRIFQHGFTTRKDGHGFGLHSGAIAARALGGTLEFESEGRDCGARFTLLLPTAATRSAL